MKKGFWILIISLWFSLLPFSTKGEEQEEKQEEKSSLQKEREELNDASAHLSAKAIAQVARQIASGASNYSWIQKRLKVLQRISARAIKNKALDKIYFIFERDGEPPEAIELKVRYSPTDGPEIEDFDEILEEKLKKLRESPFKLKIQLWLFKNHTPEPELKPSKSPFSGKTHTRKRIGKIYKKTNLEAFEIEPKNGEEKVES